MVANPPRKTRLLPVETYLPGSVDAVSVGDPGENRFALLLKVGASDSVQVRVLCERREQDDVARLVPANGTQRRDFK